MTFADLDSYAALPRVAGLWLSPDGRRLVTGVATPDRKNARYVTGLWEVDPEGERPARRLTRGSEGEAGAAFTSDGDLLFVAKRPDPEASDDEEPRAALWLLPAAGGDPRVVASPRGGVSGVGAGATGTAVLGSALMPSATGFADDEQIRKLRTDGGTSAVLHTAYPARFWDHDLGPDRTRLFVTDLSAGPRDVTGHTGGALEEGEWEISPDGGTVVTTWAVEEHGRRRVTMAAIDVATGERRTIASAGDAEFESPRVSPDGAHVALLVTVIATPERPHRAWLGVVPIGGGPVRELAREWDHWPRDLRWTPDGAALIVTADDHGRCPIFRVDAGSGAATRLTPDDGAYTDLRISPDGRWAYALRSAVDSPPAPVRVALHGEPAVQPLRSPAEPLELPGRLTEVTATAADGAEIRAWLALPHDTGPAPLLLWVHGGPYNSWNSWSWRWNPWLAVSRGYAVLLPDPALSTGYGTEFLARGWTAWGEAPFTDLMAITDAAVARDDIDETRTAAMGGSFGGYMANWIAGHTDRFSAIVTHASLWALDQFAATTDTSDFWAREMTAEMTAANSPHRFAAEITTPLLIIHGDKDYRVPVGEALRLWWDLRSRADDSPHRFLYFPDEGHWILKPGNAKAWYATVFAFLDEHVLGKEWRRPPLLG